MDADGGLVPLVVHDRDREVRGVVRAGESWAAAARRTSASPLVDPEPLDLSGEVKRFVIDHEVSVGLRAMTHDDLDDVLAWRSAPEVGRWWSGGEVDAVRARYAESIDGLSPTRMWVVEVNGRSAGFVQDHRIGDRPDGAAPGPVPGAVGVDYAIGDGQWRGRGLGQRVLWAWMLRAHHRFPDASSLFAAPDHRNAASLRVLAKAGFVQGARFEERQRDGSVSTVVGCTLDVRTVLE